MEASEQALMTKSKWLNCEAYKVIETHRPGDATPTHPSRRSPIFLTFFHLTRVRSSFVESSRPSPPSLPGQGAHGLSSKLLFSSWQDMAVRLRWTNCIRALLLTCWNTDGVHGRKLELDHFFTQHHVDICLLNETHLRPGEVCQFANYIGHRANWLTEGGRTAVLCCSTLYLWRVWGMLRQLSYWPTGHWESWLSTSCLPGPKLTWTCLPALVVVFQFWWRETLMPSTRTGILGW